MPISRNENTVQDFNHVMNLVTLAKQSHKIADDTLTDLLKKHEEDDSYLTTASEYCGEEYSDLIDNAFLAGWQHRQALDAIAAVGGFGNSVYKDLIEKFDYAGCEEVLRRHIEINFDSEAGD